MAVTKILFTFCLALPLLGVSIEAADNENYLDIESPNVFNYNSPLKQPNSLNSRPYFDFLSTLYRHDNTKSDLFRPYIQRQRREISDSEGPSPIADTAAAAGKSIGAAPAAVVPEVRKARAILFRPLFVYKQQEVRREEEAERRRRLRYRKRV